ncbi:MAG TPA: class I SAM-dependent methyltransferase [Chitinophagaceae bacterium]
MIEAISYKTDPFEQRYIDLRKTEGRIYNDAEVLQLPSISKDHPHYTEWRVRKESAARLKKYFEKRLSLPKILDVGCGNGWFSHHLAYIPGCDVTGIDVNFTELQQASRVFSHIPNLRFEYGSIDAGVVSTNEFDFIVFASCIQYFPSLSRIIEQAKQKLKPAGEIHILDSPFYKASEISVAKKRTAEYYKKIGFPEMTQHYFHHSLDELMFYHYRIMYSPSWVNRYFLNNKNPFCWIIIRK